MDMKKLIQQMTDIESSAKQQLTESTLEECGEAAMPAPENPGNPVTMSVTLNASGKDHVADLIDMMKNAGLEKAGPVTPDMMPMRQDMERLRDIVDGPMDDPEIPGDDDIEGDSDLKAGMLGKMAGAAIGGPVGAAIGDKLTDDELEESVDTKEMMGQIRKTAKGVETSPDEREHRMFAQQIESKLIELFQTFKNDMDMEKARAVSELIKRNKQAQQQTDRRNANNMVTVLWDLMNANESYTNAPDEEYQDHEFMTRALSGGINREKKAYAAAQPGDNAMAVEDEDDMRESIRLSLMKALAEKKAKPDFLDMDKDGDKKEPMKKALKDKKKKGPVKESLAKLPREDVKKAYQIYAKYMKQGSLGAEAEDIVADFAITKLGYSEKDADMLAQRAAIMHIDAVGEAEVQTPNHELSDTARQATKIAQMVKRKINSGEQMDDRDYNQLAELGAVLSRFGASFGPKSMKDVMAHMKQYTDERNEEGHGYPEFNVDRFKELLAMAKSTGESMVGEISSDLAKRYTKNAKVDRDNTDHILSRDGSTNDWKTNQKLQRRNAKRTAGINRAKKRM